MTKVKVYTTDYCGYCNMAKRLLDNKKIEYEEIDVSGDAKMRDYLINQTGQRTVPQIFINDESIGGFTELSKLNSSGELEEMLAE